jgi:small subunit ribosomal protein S20
LANTKQAKKRAKQSEKHRQHNVALRSKLRTYIKKVVLALTAKDVDTARSAYANAVPVIDGMVNKKIIHRNKAARHKERLNAHIKALAASK